MNKYFHTRTKIIKYVYEPISFEKFKDIIEKERPKKIYNSEWGESPFIQIKYNKDKILYCVPNVTKIFKSSTIEDLYKYLCKNSLQDCYIK